MGKIIGGKKVSVKTFTEEEVSNITLDLNAKVVELTEEVKRLTVENVKLNDERDNLQEINNNLNAKVVELTEKIKKTKKDNE